MPDFTCLDENLFAKVAQTLLQHISSTHCNFKSALGPSILLLCVRLADVQMNGFINYCILTAEAYKSAGSACIPIIQCFHMHMNVQNSSEQRFVLCLTSSSESK